MYIVNTILVCFVLARAESAATTGSVKSLAPTSQSREANETTQSTPFHKNANVTHRVLRRILNGRPAGETRPYMVYLRPAASADSKITDTDWLCGGVIIHERYILTSAACIEDAKNFYVVSGTHKWIPFSEKENECINNGAKKAIWKCVPKAYYFDGDEFDNIRWMVGDIAVVKVEDPFNFERKIRGCDYIPKKVIFNNRSEELEKRGTIGSMAGWGSTDQFMDKFGVRAVNSIDLLETDTLLYGKKACMKSWDARYHFIIQEHMICTRDHDDQEVMSAICLEREVNCKELVYSGETSDEGEENLRRMIVEPNELEVDTAAHLDSRRKGHRIASGGFCENDHGGPLIVGQGLSSVVIGIMSACLTREVTHKCYGPYLFTSVYKYRNLISCAIDKDIEPTCRKLLRSSRTSMVETLFDWSKHPDGLPDARKVRKLHAAEKSREPPTREQRNFVTQGKTQKAIKSSHN